jgi:ketosteroid isomerase-like protein
MTPEEAIEQVFEAWQALDVDKLITLFAEDGRYEDPLFPDALVGHGQMRDGIAPAMSDLADCAIARRRVVSAGDTGMAEADFDFAMVVEMAGGRIGRLAEYFDTGPLA